MDRIQELLYENPRAEGLIRTLLTVGAFYRTPYDANGEPLGPFVGYADGIHCGDTYIDIGVLETELPIHIEDLARNLARWHLENDMCGHDVHAIVGVPSGGILFGNALARALGVRYAFMQKVVTEPKKFGARSVSKMVFDRHSLRPGDCIMCAEDIVNNHTSSATVGMMLGELGCTHVGTYAIWDRSVTTHDGPPVFPLIRSPLPQWKIAEVTAKGYEIVPKARAVRPRLQELMRQYPLFS